MGQVYESESMRDTRRRTSLSLQVRLDRLITLTAIGSLPWLARIRGPGVPILMYHSISETNQRRGHPYFQTTTSPTDFMEQMSFLHDHGYKVITLKEATTYLRDPASQRMHEQRRDHIRRVVLTFDDGFRDFYTLAAPVLDLHGFKATVFLPTAYITQNGATFVGKECLRWSEVKDLNEQGFSFGSHTVSHPELIRLQEVNVEREIRMSKEIIEHELGAPVESFSYPYAFPEHAEALKGFLQETLAACGYINGVTTRIGTASSKDPLFFLKRIPVSSNDDLRLFAAKLKGAYDWLYWPQASYKILKCRPRS
jgi:peptidoglycan/xylan/chitin deacetylase (PgdA/CDA1 family)